MALGWLGWQQLPEVSGRNLSLIYWDVFWLEMSKSLPHATNTLYHWSMSISLPMLDFIKELDIGSLQGWEFGTGMRLELNLRPPLRLHMGTIPSACPWCPFLTRVILTWVREFVKQAWQGTYQKSLLLASMPPWASPANHIWLWHKYCGYGQILHEAKNTTVSVAMYLSISL